MSDVDPERYDRNTLTDAELEQEFRDHPITQNERFLLRLLDAERVRADAAEAKVTRVQAVIDAADGWRVPVGVLDLVLHRSTAADRPN